MRDNDGIDPEELRKDLDNFLKKGIIELFIGDINSGETLENQLLKCNSEEKIRSILDIKDMANTLKWMTRNKTESAIRIAESKEKINSPNYMELAADFING